MINPRDACMYGVMFPLVNYDGDLNELEYEKGNLCIYATINGHADVLKYLVMRGVNINKKNKQGFTPLSYACRAKILWLIKLLLDLGAERIEIDNKFSIEVKEILLTY